MICLSLSLLLFVSFLVLWHLNVRTLSILFVVNRFLAFVSAFFFGGGRLAEL